MFPNFSLQECQCFPWHFPKPIGKQFPICTFYGNHCFNAKFKNLTYMTNHCPCLPGCNSINYEYQIDSVRKFSDSEVMDFCPWYSEKDLMKIHGWYSTEYIYDDDISALMELKHNASYDFSPDNHVMSICRKYIRSEYARITIRIDGSSYLRRVQSLKHGDADKFAIIGGTLGLFTGFSFIVIFELFYWIVLTIQRVFTYVSKSNKVKVAQVQKEQYSTETLLTEMSRMQKRILVLESNEKRKIDLLGEISELKEKFKFLESRYQSKETIETGNQTDEMVIEDI